MRTGKLVWHEMMTTDLAASEKFYSELFGWRIEGVEMGPGIGTYRMIHMGSKQLGGFVPLEKEANLPSHWIAYVTVDDVDAACGRAESLGGTVSVPGTDIPNVGRFAVIRDPAGAVISPYRSAHPDQAGEQGPPAAAEFCWEELLTSDPAQARTFYGELFGWRVKEVPMGEMGVYTLFHAGEKEVAGAMKMPPEASAPPHWLPYVAVEDVDAAAQRAGELGARVYVEPKDIPEVGRFAVLADPTGAPFALFKG